MTEKNKNKNGGALKESYTGHKQLILSLSILAVAILLAYVLKISRKPPKRVQQQKPAPLVEFERVNARDIQMVVRGYGTVSPKVKVEVVPQVSGKVIWVNPQFGAGGFIRADEPIVKIDPRDYELSVQQAQAVVAEAMVALDIEKAEAQVARREWEQLNPDTEPISSLVFREPQIRQVEARLESAKAQLATTELNLERTILSLPLDVRIISEQADLGQYVMSGRLVGSAYGIEVVEIEVPLEDEELAWFDVPGSPAALNSGEPSAKGAGAEVLATFGGAQHTWTGRVVRTTGQVDKTSRLVSVVVEVPEPFDASDSRPPLVPGMFVEVQIEGRVLKKAVAVRRDAMRQGNSVWVVNNDRLHIQPLEIARADKDFAYAVSGLEDGAMIVLSSLDMATEGMKVRTHVKNATGQDTLIQDSNQLDLQGTD